MKINRLSLAIVALLVVVGAWWLTPSPWRTRALHKLGLDVGTKTPSDDPNARPMLRPPDHNRKFRDLTPEQRVQLARQPHGVGG